MATLRHADSRRLYSWWWDSHISPKNSRWLQDNLSDMDMKIKAMIKLIEEDADSFARRAEMYYKKRPELMRLVEEFYRAYRALAERYDHATGALRQAHRTIAEAFPNQMPTFSDDMSSASSITDMEYAPETSYTRSNFGFGDSPNDPFGKRNGIYSDDGDSLADRKGSKQTSGMFTSQDEGFFSNASEKKIKKALAFLDDGVEASQLSTLQEKISQLTSENESLKSEVNLGSEKSSNLENQVKQLQEAHSNIDSQKEEAILQFQECLKKVVELEAQIEVYRKVNAELLDRVEKLSRNEEACRLLEEENQILTIKVDNLEKKSNNLQEDQLHKKEEIEKLKGLLNSEHIRTAEAESAVKTLKQLQTKSEEQLKSSLLEVQHGSQMLKEMESMKKTLEEEIGLLREKNDSLCIELTQKQEEMNKLSFALQNECRRSIEMEALLQCLENLHGQSQKELKLFILDVQSSIHDLKEVEMNKQFLVEELSKIKEDIQHLNEKNTSLTIMMKFLQEKVLFLIDVQEQLQNKVVLQSDEKSVLLRDLSSMKVEIDNLCQRQKTVAEQMEAVGFSEDSFQSSVKCLQNENVDLKETCKRHEAEKLLLFERSAHMDKISEENRALENSLSDTTAELQGLREKIVVLQQSHDSLQDTNESLTNEKNNLILKVNNIEGHVEELAKKNTFLECSLSDANADLEDLRGELKNMEDSYHIVYNDKCSLDVEKNTLLSKVEDMGLSLENLKKRYEMLRNEHLNLEKEKEMTRRQLIDLQNCFNQEKLDNEEFKHCNNAKLALLESQISKLNESNLCQEEQLRNEQEKLFHLEVERFILQRSILDLINGNLSLKNKCNELELDNKGHKEKSMMLSSVNERLEMEMQTTSKDLTKEKEKYELLHDKHLELEKEKEIADRQLTDLHDCFNREKKDNENFKHCSNARLADLESQIIKLNERNHLNEIQLRNEQNKLFDIEIGRFVLQRCTSDLINGDLSLKNKCHVLEQDNKGLKEKNMMLSSENRRLEMEMQIILKALTKESCDFADKEEPCLQHILNNINELQNSVLVAKNEHLDLFVENSINDILFREIARSAVELESNSRSLEQMHRLRTDELLGLQSERCNLLQSTKHLEQNLEASYQAQKMIEEKLEILGRELLASKESEFMLHGDNNKLAKEIGLLSSQLCKLGTEKDNLQEEIDAVLQKNVALDCLSVMLKQFNVETSSKLEALLKDFTCTSDSKNHLVGKVKELDETVQVIEAENSQLKSLLLKFEEFKCHTAVLAVESNITNNINNELNCQIYQMNQQIEDMEKLLTQKKEALLDVCMILQKLRKVEEKLICNLKDTKLELDDVKCTKENLEKKILMLSKEIISKDTDIARFLEDNATLVLELAKSQKENEELKTNGSHLQKEIHYCESEVTTLLNEFQIATVQAALFEDKLLQLMGDHENVAVENFVQRRNVDDEISQNDAYVEKLNMEVDDLKGQNRIMKSELDGYLPAIRSLQKSLCGLESFVRSSQKDGNMRGQKLQDPLNFNDKLPKGISELEMLQIKVDSIREAFVHHQNQYVVHSLELTGKAYGDGTKAQEEKQIESGKPAAVDISEQVDKTEESEGVLQEVQISGNKDDLIMKDIQLDHALSLPKSERSVGPYTVVGSNALQTDDQMLELWQTDEWGHSDKSENPSAGSWIPSRHDGEVGRNENPTSELVVEKELGVDRLAMPNRNKENRQDWNKVLERLSSDAQRLTTLESGLCELKSKVERSVQMHPKNVEYDDIRGQLHEAEENILQLLDTNKKLIEKAETSSNNFTEPDLMNQRWRQVSGRARKGSEKIGRLELELQKLQYIFLKVEELDSQKTKAADRRSSVLLRDYLYGSNQSRKKNIYFCCFKPKTKAV